MRLPELAQLIKNRLFDEAITRLRTEKTRLASESLANPVMDLLQGYAKAGYKGGYGYYSGSALPEAEASLVRGKLLETLEAMLDAGLPLGFLPSTPRQMSNDEESRSRIGLGHGGSSSSSLAYDTAAGTLYVRMAGLDWREGMALLLRRGYKPGADEIDDALCNVVRTQSLSTLHHLLENHEIVGTGWKRHRDELLDRLVRWDGVDPQSVAKIINTYTDTGTNQWIESAHNDQGVCRATALGWLAMEKGAWKQLHDRLVQEQSSSAGLWTTLFREYVEHGHFKDLLDEALADGSFVHWAQKPPYKEGSPLSSWIAQAGAIAVPPDPHVDYKGELVGVVPASQRKFAQLRRTYLLLERLNDLGVPLRLGSSSDVSEGMDWAARGWVPTRAFVWRHPEVVLPSADLSTPLHVAKTPEVALAWEALGASAAPNKHGVDPWVGSMQSSDAPAPWGREIAVRIKDGRIPVNAQGKDGKTLATIAVSSPPLARLWLKKSRSKLPADMFRSALDNEQWLLAREWIEEGCLDENPSMREVLFSHVRFRSQKLSPTAEKNWDDMVSSALARPTRPWEEQANAWREMVRATGGYLAKSEPLRILSMWGGDAAARSLWTPEDNQLLPRLVAMGPEWGDNVPVELSRDEGLDLFWRILLDEEASGSGVRHDHASRVWRHFNEDLSIAQAGAGAFARLRDLDDRQIHGYGFSRADEGFKAFLEAEEMAASTISAHPPRSRSPGRRL